MSACPADLENAIHCGTESLAVTALDHRDRASRLGFLSCYLFTRYQSAGEVTDLTKAIEHDEEFIEILSTHAHRVTFLYTLRECYYLRFQQLESLADLERAIQLGEQVLAVTGSGDTGRSRILCQWLPTWPTDLRSWE